MFLFYWTRGFLAFLFLAVTILFFNAIQVASMLLVPVSRNAAWKVNRFACGSWFRLLRLTVKHGLRIKFVQSGDLLPRKENVFLIANHQSMSDIPAVVELAWRGGRAQDLKWFVKDPLKWVPGVGWGMLLLDCLFVKRNWMADKEKVLATFQRLRDHGHPFWVISFLEGTRATPAKIARSQEFGRKAGLPVLSRVQLPRTKGFEATLEGLEGRYDAVYDLTIGYEGPKPVTIVELFTTRVDRIHVHVKRYPASQIPKASKERADWAVARFVEKDQLLERFQREGNFGI